MSNTTERPTPLVIPQEVKDQLEIAREHPEYEWARKTHSWDFTTPSRFDEMTAWADHGGWDVEVIERNEQGQVTAVRGDIFRVMWQLAWFQHQSA